VGKNRNSAKIDSGEKIDSEKVEIVEKKTYSEKNRDSGKKIYSEKNVW